MMNIDGARLTPASVPVSQRSQGTAVPRNDSVPEELTAVSSFRRLFAGDSTLPQGLIASLETELIKAGFDLAAMDRSTAIRALLLFRHGLPLTTAAVTGTLAEQPSTIADVVKVLALARETLLDRTLSGTERAQVLSLINSLDGFLSGAGERGLADTFAAMTGAWGISVEENLLALLDGESETSVVLSGQAAGVTDATAVLLVAERTLERIDPAYRELIRSFREALDGFVREFTGQSFSDEKTVAAFRESFLRFGATLDTIARQYTNLPVEGLPQGQLTVFLKDLFSRQLKTLASRLLLDAPETSDATLLKSVFKNAGIINRSGMQFEWRMLAWYRSGRDPNRLRDIMSRDLKGVLRSFAGQFAGRQEKTSSRAILESLARTAGEAARNIETLQHTNLLNRFDPERAVLFELPLPGPPGGGHARVKAAPAGEETTEQSTTKRFTISFAVDTTALGPVAAFMTVDGGSVSLEILLDHDEFIRLGEGMADEISGQLREHGFAVGEITFRRTSSANDSQKRTSLSGGEVVA